MNLIVCFIFENNLIYGFYTKKERKVSVGNNFYHLMNFMGDVSDITRRGQFISFDFELADDFLKRIVR